MRVGSIYVSKRHVARSVHLCVGVFGILCVTGDLPACSGLPGGRGRPLARPAVGSTRGRPACRLETQSSRAPPPLHAVGPVRAIAKKPLAIHAPIETRMRSPFPFPYTENTENADTMMCDPCDVHILRLRWSHGNSKRNVKAPHDAAQKIY